MESLLRCWLISIFFIFRSKGTYSMENGKDMLNGINLRVSAFEYPPFMMSHRGAKGNVTYSGASVNSLNDMAKYFHLRLTYVPIDPAEVAKYGVGMTVIHQLQNDQVDFAAFPFSQMLEFSYRVDLCYPIGIDDFILMQPFPKEKSRLSAPIKPFSYQVWIIGIISVAAFIIIAAIIVSYTRNHSDPPPTFLEQLYRQFEYVLKIITTQGNATPREFDSFALRLMVALWLFSMVVLINAYIGTFTARLAVTKLEPTVDTLEELAASKTFKMAVERTSDMKQKAMEAESGPYKVFGDTFRKHPDLLFTQPLDSISKVVERNCAYPGPTNMINFLINIDFKSHGECRMTKATKSLPHFFTFSFAFQKKSPYTATYYQKFMLRAWENGFIESLRQKSFPPIPRQCQPWGGKRLGDTPFKLNDFVGVFVLFSSGCLIAIFVFVTEFSTFRKIISTDEIIV